jgi:tryptophan 7-halogenase
MHIPEMLRYKMSQFVNSGRVVKYGGDLFAAPNWIAVFMGQELWPERYDTLSDQRDVADMRGSLENIRKAIRRAAEAAPRHEEYIAQHCRGGVAYGG